MIVIRFDAIARTCNHNLQVTTNDSYSFVLVMSVINLNISKPLMIKAFKHFVVVFFDVIFIFLLTQKCGYFPFVVKNTYLLKFFELLILPTFIIRV